jgi:hypothetical protein
MVRTGEICGSHVRRSEVWCHLLLVTGVGDCGGELRVNIGVSQSVGVRDSCSTLPMRGLIPAAGQELSCILWNSKAQKITSLVPVLIRAVESESEGILGGVGVGRNFRWSRSRKEF